MPSELEKAIARHRRRLIEREEAAVRELLLAYEKIETDLRISIAALQRKISIAKEAGEEISPAWFLKERRLQTIVDQVKRQIEIFGQTATAVTTREQRAAIRLAASQTDEIVRIITKNTAGIGTLLDPRVVETAVGMMGDGSPILSYYREQLAPKVAEAIRAEVIKAAAAGTDFRTIGKRLMQTGDITRQRALAVARTEVNRVRREATRQRYQDNSDIINGWEWVASKSARTCPTCLALDGTIFKLEEPFPQHVNCRCTISPIIIGVDRPGRELGAEWFDKQSAAVQADVLGKSGALAYSAGDVELKDYVGWRNDKRFGKSVYTKSTSAALAAK